MRQLPYRLFALVGSAFALAACSQGNPERPVTTIAATPVNVVEQREAEFVKLLPTCPVSEGRRAGEYGIMMPMPAIAAVVAPVVVDFAVSGVRDYLQRVEGEHTGSFMAAGAGKLAEGGEGCLVIGRGVLGKPSAALPKQGSLEGDHMVKVGLAQPPAFYLEVKVRTTVRQAEGKKDAAPQTVLDFTPQLLHYAQTVAKRGKDEEKTVAAVVILRSTAAPEQSGSATAAKDAEAVFPLNFGKLVPGTEVRPAQFSQVADHPLADLRRTTTVNGTLSNLNVYAFVTETPDPNKVLSLLNKTLERQGDSLQKAINSAVEGALKPAK
jgi:hypothetical protein